MADYDVGHSNIYKRSLKIPFIYAAADTVKSCTLTGKGKVHSIILTLPNFTTATTGTLTFENTDSTEFYNSTAKAENVTYVLTSIDRVLAETITIKLTLDAGAGGAHTAYATIYFE
ncbi:MAG: hypothetical protein Q8L68_02345 [Methylococcales bacterium]|nr:hypothetical protein [Methylococcales bacterium]